MGSSYNEQTIIKEVDRHFGEDYFGEDYFGEDRDSSSS